MVSTVMATTALSTVSQMPSLAKMEAMVSSESSLVFHTIQQTTILQHYLPQTIPRGGKGRVSTITKDDGSHQG